MILQGPAVLRLQWAPLMENDFILLFTHYYNDYKVECQSNLWVLGPLPIQGVPQPTSAHIFHKISNKKARERWKKRTLLLLWWKVYTGHRCKHPQLFMAEDLSHTAASDVTDIIHELHFHPCKQKSLRGNKQRSLRERNDMCFDQNLVCYWFSGFSLLFQ